MSVVCLFTTGGGTLSAQDASDSYPRKTVTIICPWSAGGGTDRVSRFWADALQREFEKPFVVVNRTGGAGAVGHFAGAHARPDGHTIATITFELCTMHRMRISKLTYEDYECLLQMNADPAALIVRADAPWKSLSEWLDAVRASPGQLNMSGTATGGAWDLARAGLLQAADLPVDSVVWVPHPGAAPSLVELMGGHLDSVCCSVPEVAPQLMGGQVRVLAVMAEKRMAGFPDIPTAKEQGVDWVAMGWRGLALPKGTPPEIIRTLEEKCRAIAESDEYRTFMQKNGFGITIRGPDEFTEFLRQQDAQWKTVVEAAGYDQGTTARGDPGPLALPSVLVICLVVGSSVVYLGARRTRRAPPSNPPAESTGPGGTPMAKEPEEVSGPTSSRGVQGLQLWGLAAAVLVYVVAIEWVGFAASTLIFATLSVRHLGGRWWSAALAALAIVAVICALFVGAFRVQLPAGVLGLPF